MLSRKSGPVQAASRGVGEILVSEGVITSEQLEEAYRLGRQHPQEVGRILLSLGYVDESDLAKALARRLRLEFTELTVKDIDREAAGLVDRKVLRRYGMLPLRVESGRLVVAMRDPTNLHALEDLRMLSGYPISPVVVVESDLRRAFGELFGIGDEVAELLEEAATESPAQDREDVELRESQGVSGAPYRQAGGFDRASGGG
jgi:type IV pilus assembly protein PilB